MQKSLCSNSLQCTHRTNIDFRIWEKNLPVKYELAKMAS